MKKILKECIPYFIIIITVVLIRTFLITPVQVDGPSMKPTLQDNQLLLLSKYKNNYQRFDIVVFNFNNSKLVKRVIGLPGDYVEYKDNKLYINGNYVEETFGHATTADFSLKDIGYQTIPKDMYFVEGDNRVDSLDSRYIGLISKKQIEGVVSISLWPLKKVK